MGRGALQWGQSNAPYGWNEEGHTDRGHFSLQVPQDRAPKILNLGYVTPRHDISHCKRSSPGQGRPVPAPREARPPPQGEEAPSSE